MSTKGCTHSLNGWCRRRWCVAGLCQQAPGSRRIPPVPRYSRRRFDPSSMTRSGKDHRTPIGGAKHLTIYWCKWGRLTTAWRQVQKRSSLREHPFFSFLFPPCFLLLSGNFYEWLTLMLMLQNCPMAEIIRMIYLVNQNHGDKMVDWEAPRVQWLRTSVSEKCSGSKVRLPWHRSYIPGNMYTSMSVWSLKLRTFGIFVAIYMLFIFTIKVVHIYSNPFMSVWS